MTDIIKATAIDINRSTQTAESIRRIVAACLTHVTGNAVMLHARNAEALHQTRVGVRRTRSALALFKKQLDKESRKRLNGELKVLGAVLGRCRDWDVFLAETLPKIAKMRDVDGDQLDRIQQKAEAKRHAAYEQSSSSKEWSELSAQIEVIALRGEELADPISETAPDLLSRQSRRVRQCMRHLATSEQRHALRKAMKKLRYSVEFFDALYRNKAAKSYLDQCKAVQEVLGDMNDANTTARLCAELQESGLPMAEFLVEWAERHQSRAANHLAATIAAFRSVKPFWH